MYWDFYLTKRLIGFHVLTVFVYATTTIHDDCYPRAVSCTYVLRYVGFSTKMNSKIYCRCKNKVCSTTFYHVKLYCIQGFLHFHTVILNVFFIYFACYALSLFVETSGAVYYTAVAYLSALLYNAKYLVR